MLVLNYVLRPANQKKHTAIFPCDAIIRVGEDYTAFDIHAHGSKSPVTLFSWMCDVIDLSCMADDCRKLDVAFSAVSERKCFLSCQS